MKNVAWSDESRFLLHSDGRVRIRCKEHESMDPSCLVSMVQAGDGGVMVWGIFSWHTLGPLVPIEHCLNATAYWVFLLTMSIPLWLQCTHLLMYFQQDNAPCHKAQIISDWFLEHDNEFTLLKWPPQSPDLNPIEHLWDVVEREIHIMDVQPTNLQQLRDTIMSIWTTISEECIQNLIESMPRRIKTVLKTKGDPTRDLQSVPNKVASECTVLCTVYTILYYIILYYIILYYIICVCVYIYIYLYI